MQENGPSEDQLAQAGVLDCPSKDNDTGYTETVPASQEADLLKSIAEHDRAWFFHNPTRRFRVRAAFPYEFRLTAPFVEGETIFAVCRKISDVRCERLPISSGYSLAAANERSAKQLFEALRICDHGSLIALVYEIGRRSPGWRAAR
jgi:hypothetical protein